jgi:hypothetical protein
MSMAKQYGADRIWIVNVGHFKGYEFPMEYFLDLAWDTRKLTNDNISEYTRSWAIREFGNTWAGDAAEIVSLYTKYNGRRKPELLSPSTYSFTNYNEAEKVVEDFRSITARADSIYKKLPSEKRDAFYQLVLFPAKASYIVNDLYAAAGKNDLYFRQGRASTNDMADRVRLLFQTDTSLMGYYNRDFAGGKWNHFMDQSHLGYNSWADPPFNSLRAINLKQIDVPVISKLGVAIEGSEDVWPGSENNAVLPDFDIFNRQKHYFEIFNKGSLPFVYTVTIDHPWIITDKSAGNVNKDERILVSIDWDKAPEGLNKGSIKISGAGEDAIVYLNAFAPAEPDRVSLEGFVEGEGYVSVEAEHFTAKKDEGENEWICIEDYGYNLSAMRATAPTEISQLTPGNDSPCLEYRMYLFNPGELNVISIFSPTLNFIPGRPLRYGISFDDQSPQVIPLVPGDYNAQNGNADWERSVSNNARFSNTTHTISHPGFHTLKIWMIDPGVVIQKIIVNTGGLKPSYLGPPESFYKPVRSGLK